MKQITFCKKKHTPGIDRFITNLSKAIKKNFMTAQKQCLILYCLPFLRAKHFIVSCFYVGDKILVHFQLVLLHILNEINLDKLCG